MSCFRVFALLAALLASVALLAPPTSGASCSSDTLRSAREAVAASCNCAAYDGTPGKGHGAYVSCVAHALSALVKAHSLDPSCRGEVQACAAHSTCGKPGAVTCCITGAHGKPKGTVKPSAASCKAPRGGTACVGNYASVCDACSGSQCTGLCGNGKIEYGEECDGQSICRPDCKLPVTLCCPTLTNNTSCTDLSTRSDGDPALVAFGQSCTTIASMVVGGVCVPNGSTDPDCSRDGVCGSCTPVSVPETTICCNEGALGCRQATVTDTAHLLNAMFGCSFPVVGQCGPDGHCIPAGQ